MNKPKGQDCEVPNNLETSFVYCNKSLHMILMMTMMDKLKANRLFPQN